MDDRREGWNWWAHFLAWVGGGMVALAPFVGNWVIALGAWVTPARMWPGNLMVEMIVGGVLALVGVTLGGYGWCAWGQRRGWWGLAGVVCLLGWGILAWLGVVAEWVHWVGMGVAVVGLLGLWVLRWGWDGRRCGGGRRPCNGLLFGWILALMVAADLTVLAKLEGRWLAVLALVVVRVLTQAVLACGLWQLLESFARWSPRGTRWLGGVVCGWVMVALAADIGMSLLWGKGLTLFFGELAVGGKFDLGRVMEGGNFEVGWLQLLMVAGVIGLVAGVLVVTGRLSTRLGMRMRPGMWGKAALVLWGLLLVEQASEWVWGDRGIHWFQRRGFMVHLTPELSEPGWATFDVAFRDAPRAAAGVGVGSARPDIYWFVVETLRADVVKPELMPFLSGWRDRECQPMGSTHAASNATHLSWYAMLSGRPSVFWERDRKLRRPAPLLELLKSAGYRNEVRTASIFDYAEMDTTNFGHGEATDEMVSVRVDPDAWPSGFSERDLRVQALWKESVRARPAGGVFRLTAVESPHYPYAWGPGFVPPYADYHPAGLFPLRPGQRDIERVRNRYGNSVAWVDGLLEDYVGFLKESGRYEDALIVVTGDHGEELQERGFWFHASALTREQTEVPLLVKWPAGMGRGERVAQASQLDLVPSVMELLGCEPESWAGMAGRPLRGGGDGSVLVTSHFASQNGEGMHWRRNGYEAAFGWKKVWVPGEPVRVWLERLSGPGGDLKFDTPAQAEEALKRLFPDALERWFERFERADSGGLGWLGARG